MPWLHAVIDVPADRQAAASRFWSRTLGWPLGPPWSGHPELRSFEPPEGSSYLHLQEIEGPARVHLDLESTDPAATVDEARRAGARLVAEHDRWQTLVSPGGLPFCVLEAGGRQAPDPTTWPDGHRSRMVQIAIDSPAAVHDDEVTFWRSLLQGRWVDSPAREFAGKWHDDAGSPLQLLFQRLDEPDGVVRAHLDHGTDDVEAEVARLGDLGAEDIGPGRGWHTLRDPAGLLFCVTGNSPAQTAVRDDLD
jgi:glyoxalase superfamily protein